MKNSIFMGAFNVVRKEDYEYTINNKNVWKLVGADDKNGAIKTSTTTLDFVKKLGYNDTFILLHTIKA